ncbi:hypothetical protein [Aquisphaera giovannonii]|uniref:hypothetical protein n=1 Tax=Aquisphaera giovannonii TaxID=406548 RepID=UPI0011E03AB3|nr:hypothetical protein [Aquisphaera giovannonii]
MLAAHDTDTTETTMIPRGLRRCLVDPVRAVRAVIVACLALMPGCDEAPRWKGVGTDAKGDDGATHRDARAGGEADEPAP